MIKNSKWNWSLRFGKVFLRAESRVVYISRIERIEGEKYITI